MEKEFETFESFKHGLVVSKMWLCEELEKIIPENKSYDLHVLGGWTNLIGFMLLVRNTIKLNSVNSYDKDLSANLIADKILDAWRIENPKANSFTMDIDDIDYSIHTKDNIYINCSVEHLSSRKWFDQLPKGSIVAIQATDVNDVKSPWFIKDYVPNLESIIDRYPLDIKYKGIKEIRYSGFGYNRFMIIGIK